MTFVSSLLQGGMALGQMFGGGGSEQSSIYNNMAPQFYAAQGIQQQNIDLQQKFYGEQANAIMQDAFEQAKVTQQQGRQMIGQHSIDYAKSGVMISDTPLKVLQKERQMVQADVQSIMRRGQAQANLLRMQGQIAANEGRAQMIGANMQFAAQRQQAAMADSASRSNNFMSALGALSNVFGSMGGGKPLGGLSSLFGGGSSFSPAPITPMHGYILPNRNINDLSALSPVFDPLGGI